MTLERLRESPDGLVWPLYSLEDKERTGSVFAEGKLLTPSGKMKAVDTLFGRFPQWDYPKGSPLGKDRSDDFPLVLTQGKQLWHWQQTLTNFSKAVAQFSNGRFICLHPETAQGLGLAQGDRVMLETSVGGIEGWVDITENVLPGTIFTPSNCNATTPAAGEPERAHQQHTPQLLGPHFLPAQRRRLPAAQAGVRASMTA